VTQKGEGSRGLFDILVRATQAPPMDIGLSLWPWIPRREIVTPSSFPSFNSFFAACSTAARRRAGYSTSSFAVNPLILLRRETVTGRTIALRPVASRGGLPRSAESVPSFGVGSVSPDQERLSDLGGFCRNLRTDMAEFLEGRADVSETRKE